jgi:hypothetical protein
MRIWRLHDYLFVKLAASNGQQANRGSLIGRAVLPLGEIIAESIEFRVRFGARRIRVVSGGHVSD